MDIIKLILILLILIGIVGFLVTWVHAYSKVKEIKKWSQQAFALQPWWFLDPTLLDKEHEHIRYSAIKYFLMYSVPMFILWWLSDS